MNWTPLERVKKEFSPYSADEVKIVRSQFPVTPAQAMTYWKAQGGTFSEIVVKVHNKISRQQLYVALSRVTKLDGLFIDGNFIPPAPANNFDPVEIELKRLREQCFLDFDEIKKESDNDEENKDAPDPVPQDEMSEEEDFNPDLLADEFIVRPDPSEYFQLSIEATADGNHLVQDRNSCYIDVFFTSFFYSRSHFDSLLEISPQDTEYVKEIKGVISRIVQELRVNFKVKRETIDLFRNTFARTEPRLRGRFHNVGHFIDQVLVHGLNAPASIQPLNSHVYIINHGFEEDFQERRTIKNLLLNNMSHHSHMRNYDGSYFDCLPRNALIIEVTVVRSTRGLVIIPNLSINVSEFVRVREGEMFNMVEGLAPKWMHLSAIICFVTRNHYTCYVRHRDGWIYSDGIQRRNNRSDKFENDLKNFLVSSDDSSLIEASEHLKRILTCGYVFIYN